MSEFDEQSPVIRWPARTIKHAIDSYAWAGSLLAAVLGVLWVAQSQLGIDLPAGVNRATVAALGYWSGRGSLLLVGAVLIQAAARAGIDEGRHTRPVSPGHIRDLQAEAGRMRQSLFRPYGFFAVDVQGVSAQNFCKHFPEIAATLQGWNQDVAAYWRMIQILHAREEPEAAKPITGTNVTLAGVLSAVTRGYYAQPAEVTWSVVGVGIPPVKNIAFHDPRSGQDITVCTIPDGVDAVDLQQRIQQRLNDAMDWPEAVKFREESTKLEGLKANLIRELESATLNHTPAGCCDTCQPPKKGKACS